MTFRASWSLTIATGPLGARGRGASKKPENRGAVSRLYVGTCVSVTVLLLR